MVLIHYEDIYGNGHDTWQELRARVERREDDATVLLTFGDEILDSDASAAIEQLKTLQPEGKP